MILEQDLDLLVGQQAVVDSLAENLDSVYTPLPTADTFAIAYRQWLDKFGQSLPNYRGYTTSKQRAHQPNLLPPSLKNRWERHTQICGSCSNAHKSMIRVKQICSMVIVGLTAMAIITSGLTSQLLILGTLLALLLAVCANTLKSKLEN